MNRYLAIIIASILESVVIGLLIKYTNYEIALITLLIQIYIQLLLKN